MPRKTEEEAKMEQLCPETCPLGKFFSTFAKKKGQRSDFSRHLSQSQVEVLKAVRSLVDMGIEYLEGRAFGKAGKKATKIEVE
jgi:hypothetical protein